MIKLLDISLKEYLGLYDKSDYDFAMKYSKKPGLYNDALNVYSIKPLIDFSFGLIKDIQSSFSQKFISWNELIDFFVELTGIKKEKLINQKLVAICRFKKYVYDEVSELINNENELLKHIPTTDEESAGIDEFGKYGVYIQLRKLANEDITKIEDIRKIKYSSCLLELLYQKDLYNYQTKLNKIKKPKQKK